MNTKKIKLYSLATTYPESTSSTKPRFVHVLNRELVKLGINVKVIVPHSKGALTSETIDSVFVRRFRYLPEDYELNYISIAEEIRKSKFGKLKIIIMTLNLLIFTIFECLKEKPDIIHGQWGFPGGYIAFLVSKIFGTKYVVSIHGAETPLLKKFKLIQKLVINSLNKSSIVIVNSSYTREEYIKMGLNKDKITKIYPTPNFVKHISDKEFLSKFRKQFTTNDSKIILFCGRLVERKGVEYLIRSLPEIKAKNIHLIIAGGGGQLTYLKDLSSSLGLDNKITFFGPASHEELGALHDTSDVFVCPSIIDSTGETEGLGLVIPEAMESGLPVIATSVGGIVDIIQNEINGILVPQKDPKAIAEAIDKILSDQKLVERFVENSKKTVNEFQPKIIAEKHLSIFENMMKT